MNKFYICEKFGILIHEREEHALMGRLRGPSKWQIETFGEFERLSYEQKKCFAFEPDKVKCTKPGEPILLIEKGKNEQAWYVIIGDKIGWINYQKDIIKPLVINE